MGGRLRVRSPESMPQGLKRVCENVLSGLERSLFLLNGNKLASASRAWQVSKLAQERALTQGLKPPAFYCRLRPG